MSHNKNYSALKPLSKLLKSLGIAAFVLAAIDVCFSIKTSIETGNWDIPHMLYPAFIALFLFAGSQVISLLVNVANNTEQQNQVLSAQLNLMKRVAEKSGVSVEEIDKISNEL
jgi:hypothetical protein